MEMNLFNEVKDYILERIEHEDLTIDAIASHLRMSRTKFYNRWKTLTGEAPTVFIEAIRMEKPFFREGQRLIKRNILSAPYQK